MVTFMHPEIVEIILLSYFKKHLCNISRKESHYYYDLLINVATKYHVLNIDHPGSIKKLRDQVEQKHRKFRIQERAILPYRQPTKKDQLLGLIVSNLLLWKMNT